MKNDSSHSSGAGELHLRVFTEDELEGFSVSNMNILNVCRCQSVKMCPSLFPVAVFANVNR